LIKLGAAVMLEATSSGSLPLALPIKESIRLSPSSSNSERTLFKACLVLTFSGTISSSIFLAFLAISFSVCGTSVVVFLTASGLTSGFLSAVADLAASVFFSSSFFSTLAGAGTALAAVTGATLAAETTGALGA